MSKATVRAGEMSDLAFWAAIGLRARTVVRRRCLRSESLSGNQPVSPDEVSCGHTLLAFQLDFEQIKPGSATAADQQAIATPQQFADPHIRSMFERFSSADLKLLAAEDGVRARPRLESAQAIVDFECAPIEVDETVFLLEDWRTTCLSMVLRNRLDCSVLEPAQRIDHQFGAGRRQARSQRFRRVFRRNRFLSLLKDVPGIQPGVYAHGSNARYTFA